MTWDPSFLSIEFQKNKAGGSVNQTCYSESLSFDKRNAFRIHTVVKKITARELLLIGPHRVLKAELFNSFFDERYLKHSKESTRDLLNKRLFCCFFFFYLLVLKCRNQSACQVSLKPV